MTTHTAPSAQDQFDDETSRRIEAVYLTPDVLAQREKVLAMLAPREGEIALDIGCGPGLTTQALALQVGASGKVIGVERIAIMTALNLAHELLNSKSGNVDVGDIKRRIAIMQDQIDQACEAK